MHFIEDWFGISPDGGNGLLEVAYIVALSFGLVVAAAVLKRRARATPLGPRLRLRSRRGDDAKKGRDGDHASL
jgi:hypothetical protein